MTAKDLRPYKPGDRVWWMNSWGQQFRATVLDKTSNCLIVRRDDDYAERTLDLDEDAVRSMHHKVSK